MTVEKPPAEVHQQIDQSVTGPATHLLDQLAARLHGSASVTAVYGEPVERQGVTIIPVAKVSLGFGGGAGIETKESKSSSGGGGGGGGASATPLGYIEIKDGTAVFKPIREPLTDVLLPLVAIIAGSAVPRLVRAILKRRT